MQKKTLSRTKHNFAAALYESSAASPSAQHASYGERCEIDGAGQLLVFGTEFESVRHSFAPWFGRDRSALTYLLCRYAESPSKGGIRRTSLIYERRIAKEVPLFARRQNDPKSSSSICELFGCNFSRCQEGAVVTPRREPRRYSPTRYRRSLPSLRC